MKITIEQLITLALKYKLRIVIEENYVSFIHGCRVVDFYDAVLKKINIYDVESSIKSMIGGTNEED